MCGKLSPFADKALPPLINFGFKNYADQYKFQQPPLNLNCGKNQFLLDIKNNEKFPHN